MEDFSEYKKFKKAKTESSIREVELEILWFKLKKDTNIFGKVIIKKLQNFPQSPFLTIRLIT